MHWSDVTLELGIVHMLDYEDIYIYFIDMIYHINT